MKTSSTDGRINSRLSAYAASIGNLLGRRCAAAAVAFVLALLTSQVAFAQAPDAGNKPFTWPYTFPIWGNKLAERGIKFPLPFGIGLNYAYADQPIAITRIAVGVNGGPMQDLSKIIKFGDLRSKVQAMNLRADLWVLPFLNVYVMGNYIYQSETQVPIVEPFAFTAGATQQGTGGGLGTTLSGGAWGFFGTLDLNWTWNKMEKLDKPVGTFLLTPRVGKNFGKWAGLEWILWVGAMRQKIESKTQGSINLKDAVNGAGDGSFQSKLEDWYNGLPPAKQAVVGAIVDKIGGGGNPVINYDLDKAIKYPWNMVVGGELGVTKAFRVRAEVGFIQRTQLVLGLNYRFGL
jgi:hypothetical protein